MRNEGRRIMNERMVESGARAGERAKPV